MLILTIKFPRYSIKTMTDEVSLEAIQSAIKKDNEQVALKLSFLPNSPNARGENRIDEERYRLEQTRPSWENIESPIVVGDEVLITTGTPVRFVPEGAYITGEPIWGTLARTHSLRGGSGYMEQGHRTRAALSLVTRPHIKGQAPIEAVDLLVPNDMYEAVLQEPTNILPNTPIA